MWFFTYTMIFSFFNVTLGVTQATEFKTIEECEQSNKLIQSMENEVTTVNAVECREGRLDLSEFEYTYSNRDGLKVGIKLDNHDEVHMNFIRDADKKMAIIGYEKM